jgi:hypothetical protein
MNAAMLARALDPRARRSGAAWLARCPAHDDRSPSLSVRDGAQGVLLTCHAGCERGDVIAELRARGLWAAREMAPRRAVKPRQAPTAPRAGRQAHRAARGCPADLGWH